MYSTVNTRIKMKFTQASGQNPSPGSVVDHSVNQLNDEGKEDYSFYMVSTECRQGVPTPTQYSVIVDEINAPPELFQSLVYKLSYLFYNFSGAVKLPSVVKYANRLATIIV